MTQTNSKTETKLSIDTIKDRLKTLTSAADVFNYLGTIWMKKHWITKEEYNELWKYWKENKPKVVKRNMTPEEQGMFGDLVKPGTQIEETVPRDSDGNPDVENIPF